MIGITGFGAHIPRLRLQRQALLEANAWANAALKAHGKGERSMCNWDEDAVTLAVAAARDGLAGRDREGLRAVLLASTSLPFADRQNAGIVAAALHLPHSVLSLDLTGAQKAGTSGLIAALHMTAGMDGEVLLAAADHRHTKAGSVQELQFGDGAAALTVGRGDGVVARVLATHAGTVDFIDHFRGARREFDYAWEERWIRDEGYLKLVPPAVQAVLAQADVAPERVTHFVMPSPFGNVPRQVARRTGLPEASVRDTLAAVCGETGAAHPLLMLVDALQEAQPGDVLLVVGFGHGCDAVLLEATETLAQPQASAGVKGALANRREESNYNKFLTFNGLLPKEFGIRAEVDNAAPLSAQYRKLDQALGLVGGRCTQCGTPQFPRAKVCVNPECNATGEQEPYDFSDVSGRVLTCTEDHLTFTLDPPGQYGMVQFEGGGRLMADFTDVAPGDVAVNDAVRMAFRIKSFDERRGFRRYFWKAVPQQAASGSGKNS